MARAHLRWFRWPLLALAGFTAFIALGVWAAWGQHDEAREELRQQLDSLAVPADTVEVGREQQEGIGGAHWTTVEYRTDASRPELEQFYARQLTGRGWLACDIFRDLCYSQDRFTFSVSFKDLESGTYTVTVYLAE